ncbi:hypothetical protein JTB14_022405 [Gonioctena quinquepunctata]|nr:hypothetical protein JTB14_022405 [Gonioctena quinquepunctata]
MPTKTEILHSIITKIFRPSTSHEIKNKAIEVMEAECGRKVNIQPGEEAQESEKEPKRHGSERQNEDEVFEDAAPI